MTGKRVLDRDGALLADRGFLTRMSIAIGWQSPAVRRLPGASNRGCPTDPT